MTTELRSTLSSAQLATAATALGDTDALLANSYPG